MNIIATPCCCVDVFPEKNNMIYPGGNALNLAVSCAKTKAANVYVMGNIGTDCYATKIKKVCDQYRIDCTHLHEIDGVTANHIINIDQNGDRYFKEESWTGGVNTNYKFTDADKYLLSQMDAVATTFYDSTFQSILEIRRKSRFLLSMDFHDEHVNNQWTGYFDAIDFLFVSGRIEELPILRNWSKLYKTIFVATLGEYGSIAYCNNVEYFCKVVQVSQVVDTTGCGDSYQGAFLVEYLQSHDIPKAMEMGSISASKTLLNVGGI